MSRGVEREPDDAATPRAPRFAVALALAFAIFLIAVVAVANSGIATRQLLDLVARIPGRDKTVHLALMGTMALLLNLAWRGACWWIWRLPIPKASVAVAIAVTIEEFTQKLVPVRSFSLEDLAYDYVGIATLGTLGAVIAHWLGRRSERRGGA